jgi:hypothetical protein
VRTAFPQVLDFLFGSWSSSEFRFLVIVFDDLRVPISYQI